MQHKTMIGPLFMKCVQFSAHKHKDQRRKDPSSTPYINHPINVATILAVEGNVSNDDVIMAALLHDTVEDTDTTFEEIEELFGPVVCGIVREVTDDKNLEKQERKRLQIVHAATSSHNAKLVKLADKLDNLRDLLINTPRGWTEVKLCLPFGNRISLNLNFCRDEKKSILYGPRTLLII